MKFVPHARTNVKHVLLIQIVKNVLETDNIYHTVNVKMENTMMEPKIVKNVNTNVLNVLIMIHAQYVPELEP